MPRTHTVYTRSTHSLHTAPDGATAIAKDLATGLLLDQNQLITAVNPIADGWQLLSQTPTAEITAKTVILAIPAPQAVRNSE